nr:hypothetical protein [Tanacetum cinerariifolium]
MATLNEPLPQGTSSGFGPKCQVTILRGTEAQTRFEAKSKQSNDPRLSRVHTLGSGEDNIKTTAKVKKVNGQEQIQALVDKQKVNITEEGIRRDLKFDDAEGTTCLTNDTIYEELSRMGYEKPSQNSTMVLDLEEAKTAQAKEIANLKKIVKKLEKRRKSRPAGLRRLKKGRSNDDIDQDAEIALVDEAQGRMHDADMFGVDDLEVTAAGVEDSVAPTTATTADVDDELTLVKTLIAIKAAKPKNVEQSLKKTQEEVTKELKRCLNIVLEDDDVAIEATSLSSKSPTIVDYKIYREGKKSYFKIIRADGNSQNYLTFRTMFKSFNREDL